MPKRQRSEGSLHSSEGSESAPSDAQSSAPPHGAAGVGDISPVVLEELVTLQLKSGGKVQMLRDAAKACDVWSSLQDTEEDVPAEVLTMELDFAPAHIHCAAERINELYRAAQRDEAAETRRRSCVDAIEVEALPESVSPPPRPQQVVLLAPRSPSALAVAGTECPALLLPDPGSSPRSSGSTSSLAT